jgi:hypothetical protein
MDPKKGNASIVNMDGAHSPLLEFREGGEMKDSVKSGLDALFRATQEKNNQVQSVEKEKERREEALLSSFYVLQKSIIRPAMEAIGKYVEEKGYKYEIDESKEGTAQDGKHQSASIAIRFFFGKESDRPTYQYPAFTVFFEKHAQKVRFHESTVVPGRGGQAGPAGEASLDEVTVDLIHTKILHVLTEAFKS